MKISPHLAVSSLLGALAYQGLAIRGMGRFVPAYSDRMDFCTFGGEGLRWIGALLLILGRRFSGLVAIQPDHQLVVDGLYRHLRTPGYLGLLVNVLGWALAFRSGLCLGLAALTLIPLLARTQAEEALLLKHFGQAYEDYRARI